MSSYMVVSNKTYHLTNECSTPYLALGNNKLPLNSGSGTNTMNLHIVAGGGDNNYRALEYKSTSNTYYTTSVNSNGLSEVTVLTRSSTSGESYETRSSTSGTNYGTATETQQMAFTFCSYSTYYNKEDEWNTYSYSYSTYLTNTMASSLSTISNITTLYIYGYSFTANQTRFLFSNNRWSYFTMSTSSSMRNAGALYSASSTWTATHWQFTLYNNTTYNTNYHSFSFNSGLKNGSITATQFSYLLNQQAQYYRCSFTLITNSVKTNTTGTTYLTRSSTSKTVYLTCSSTSGYSGVSSSSTEEWQ